MNKIAVIAGPTAVGKSSVAIEAALKYSGEVVGADSMQIYKHMDIGTGKIMPCEMRRVPHHMIDIVMPDEEYSVGRYVKEAKEKIDEIIMRGNLPIIVGGTGLYINSLLFNHSFAGAPKNDEVRNSLKAFYEREGEAALYERLRSVDPRSALSINMHDIKRVIRALEIYEITGKPRGELKDECKAEYEYLLLILTDEREKLYSRINDRVDKMFERGLVEEVKSLYEYKNCNSMQAIGYKEVISYLDGEISLDDAKDAVKQNSRRYAKRQFTYFNGMKAEKQFVDVGCDVCGMIKKFAEKK